MLTDIELRASKLRDNCILAAEELIKQHLTRSVSPLANSFADGSGADRVVKAN